MREIKFRGQCRKTGEWIYGDLIHKAITTGNKIALVGIAPHGCYAVDVDIETVGQFTGLADKNGNDAYEKDLIKLDNVFCSGDQHFYNGKFLIESHDGAFVIKSLISNWKKSIISFHGLKFEVIGNIYENPELLEDKQ